MSFLHSFAFFRDHTLLNKGPTIVSHVTGGGSYFQYPFEVLNEEGASSNKLIISETTINPEISEKNVPADFKPLTCVKECTRLNFFCKHVPFFVFRWR